MNYAIAKEKEEEAAENAKREKAKQESIAYQNYLRDLMVREAQDETSINGIRKKQEDEVWDKRDEVQRKQRDARAALMKQVHEGRQEQIRLKAIADKEDSKLQAIQVYISDRDLPLLVCAIAYDRCKFKLVCWLYVCMYVCMYVCRWQNGVRISPRVLKKIDRRLKLGERQS